MTDSPPPPPGAADQTADEAIPMPRTARRRRRDGRFSLIWLVPILALAITAALAWNTFATRGPLISVSFSDATGIIPTETTLKFREVNVGRVEAVRFTPDLDRVVVDIRVAPEMAHHIGSDARFWVVRPQVTTSGISRLDIVLTGTFIEGDWTADPAGPRPEVFRGLDRPPLIRRGDRGTWITLSAPDTAGLNDGAPVLFRGLPVGRMENLRLSPRDETVLIDAFIEAPHDARLTTATAFWNVSGFSVSLGMDGLVLDVNSVATLLQGGVTFATFASGGAPVAPGYTFSLHPDQAAAAAASPADDEADQFRVTILLPGDLRGLAQGADVQFGAITVGRVSDLAVTVPDAGPDAGTVMQAVTLALSPARLGVPAGQDGLDWLAARVGAGLRARAASGGFLGMTTILQLIDLPDAPAATLDRTALPYPLLPATDSDVQDIAGTAQGFLTRIGDLPLEEVLKSARDMLNAVTAVAASDDTRAIPGAARAMLEEIDAATGEIRAIASDLRGQEVASRLGVALDTTAEAMDSVRLAADDIPELVEQIEDTVDKIDATVDDMALVDYEGLGRSIQRLSDGATDLVGDLRAMLGTEDAAALPRNLSETLKSASALLIDLREGDAVGNLNAALDSARLAADGAREALRDLPDMTGRARALLARAEATLAAYGASSPFNIEVLGLMREARRAAASIGGVARLIERNPRAFILGR